MCQYVCMLGFFSSALPGCYERAWKAQQGADSRRFYLKPRCGTDGAVGIAAYYKEASEA